MSTAVNNLAPRSQLIGAQTKLELTLLLRNGEQLLLTLIIPVVVLLGLSLTSVVDVGATSQTERLAIVVPGVLALAIMSSAFTAQAISTGFDRRSEAIKFLGTSPLSRGGLLTAKATAITLIQVGQFVVLLGIAAAIGWRPDGNWPLSLVYLALGSLAFTALGLLMAGVLRAEINLAAANAVYLVLLLIGGIVIPANELPTPLAWLAIATPSGALADGLRATLASDSFAPGLALLVLVGWTGVCGFLMKRTFRWIS